MSLLYHKSIAVLDKIVPSKLQPLWMHPAGPKTIFFWAPIFKWGLVIAGIADLQRPADKISPAQCGALLATGLIWSRYSLVIIPKNYSLFSVNLFVAGTQCYQMYRALSYKHNQKTIVPDLEPNDFLLPNIQGKLSGQRFTRAEEAVEAFKNHVLMSLKRNGKTLKK